MRLNEERDKIVKNNSLADKTKTEPEEMVSFALKPKDDSRFKNTPDSSVLYRNILPTEMQNFLSNKTETEPEEMVSFALKPKDDSKLDIDSVNNSIRGSLLYKNLLPSDEQSFLSNNEGSIKNDESVKDLQTDYTVRDENTIWNTINQLMYGDFDSVLEQEAKKWNLPYSDDMTPIQKEKLGTVVYKYLHYELNKAKGADVESPAQDKEVLQSLYEIEYNKDKKEKPISLVASALGNVLFPQNTANEARMDELDENDTVNESCINGQGIEDNGISRLKVGEKGNVAENGCGIIAIYNALTLNGIDVEFKDVLNDANNMDDLLLRGGKWGTNPNKIGNMLAEYGVGYTMYTKRNEFNDVVKPGGTYIVSFWNDTNWGDGAHIVAFTCDENGDIIVYNASNDSETPCKYSSGYGKTGLDRYLQGRGNTMTLYKVG